MKTIKKILLVFVALLFATTIEAQPTPGFWSNWSVGGNVILTKEFSKVNNSNWAFGEGTNIGFGLTARKQLTDHWNFRIIADVPGLFTSDTMKYDRYGKGMIGFGYDFNCGLYLFADGGGAILFGTTGNDDLLKLAADFGVGYKYDLNEHNSLFAELGGDVVASFAEKFYNSNAFLKVGYVYNFGLTKVDKQILEDYILVMNTDKAVDTEADSIAKYHKTHCPDTVFAHLEKIDVLTHDNAQYIEQIELKDSIIHVLDSILDNIRAESDNFYAMPFSVEFDNDSYTIKSSQVEKVKQVAYIMNNDTTINYTVCGYCDNTGSVEYNQKLSVKRAEAVRDMLVNKYGVKESQLTVNGKGKDIAFGDINSSINRRVSFFKNF